MSDGSVGNGEGRGGIDRRALAAQLVPAEAEPADLERANPALASDRRWLVIEGYVIEFDGGSLDLPRPKPSAPPVAPPNGSNPQSVASPAEESEIAVEVVAETAEEEKTA